jgi:hypothetical protein
MNSNDDQAGTGAVQLHFCDLCNESVPQTDLDARRATLVKGRVVCATCNEAMTHHAATPQPAAAATASAKEPERSSSAAPVLAFLALCAAGGVGYWAYREIEDLRSSQQDTLVALADAQRGQSESASAFEAKLRGELAAAEQRASAAGQSRVDALAARLDTTSAGLIGAQAEVARIDQALRQLQASRGDTERQDAALAELRRGHAELAQRLASEVERLAADIAALRAGAATPTPAAPEAKRPEWFAFVEDLKSPTSATRWRAVLGLGQSKDPAAAEYLVPVLKDEDIFVRMFAARTLGDLGNPNSVSALIDALEDSEASVRAAAYAALTTITHRDLPFDPESSDGSERSRRVKAWREWWEKERGKAGA